MDKVKETQLKQVELQNKQDCMVTNNSPNKEVARQKYFYAADNSFYSNNNPVPKELENKIICGNSNDILSLLPDNSIDLILTSPPYNLDMPYDLKKDDNDWPTFFDMLNLVLLQCIRVLKFGGRLIINIQPAFSYYVPTHHFISNFLMQQKMIWKGEILWDKSHFNCNYSCWGSWQSPASPYLKYTWEYLEVFCKGDLKKPGRKELIDITPEEFKAWTVAKWNIAPERNMKLYQHPAMFPEELAKRVLKLFSYKDDIILDPFNGAGSSTLAAFKNNRRFIGIDISEQYCRVAEDRMKIFAV